MSGAVGVAVVPAKGATGNQDITTTDLGGLTPVGVLFYFSRASADAAVTSTGQVSMGCCDGTNQLSYAYVMENGVPAGSMGWAKKATDCCLCSIDVGGAVHSQASFVSFIANGVRVNWSAAGSEGWLITALFFAGSDWSAQCGTMTLIHGTLTVNLPFTPDLVFGFNNGDFVNYGSVGGPGGLESTYGFNCFGSSELFTSLTAPYYQTGGGSTGIGRYVPSAFIDYILQCSQITNGFTVTQTQINYGVGHVWGYFALGYSGVGSLVAGAATLDLSVAGDHPITLVGGQTGQFLSTILIQNYNLEEPATGDIAKIRHTYDISNNALTATGGWSMAARGTDHFSRSAPPFVELCAANKNSMSAVNWDGSIEMVGYVKSYDADGFTIHVTTPINPNAIPTGIDPIFSMLWITMIDVPAPPPPPPPPPPPVYARGGFIIERLDNRIWPTVEDCWCVDCGFQLLQPDFGASAELGVSTAFGAGILTGVTNLVGGQGYSAATVAAVVDHDGLGTGTGAVPVLTITAGVITAITFSPGGQDYVDPAIVFNDPENTGSGASATITMDNSAIWVSAPVGVFQSSDVGSVIRAGYGVAVITGFIDSSHVNVNVLSPIVQLVPDEQVRPVMTQSLRNWTMTKPVSSFYLPQLIGFTITGLADGQVIPSQVIPPDGIVTLAQPASSIIVGLAFQAQLQSTYLDAGEPTIQAQRKKIAEVSVRVEQSGGFQIGGNQPDGSVQSPQVLFAPWQNMADAPNPAMQQFNAPFQPLFTGDIRVPIQVGFGTRGQVAVQQLNPLPLQVLDYVPEVLGGDKPAQQAPERQKGKGGGRGGQEQ